jgi:hypothetical protein
MVSDHIGEIDLSGLLGQLADNILLVLPPLDLVLGFQMEIFAHGTVKLSLACLYIDFDSRLARHTIKPISDISSSSLYQGPRQLTFDIVLYGFGQIVNLPEKDNPTIIGGIMLTDLSESVVSLFGVWCG